MILSVVFSKPSSCVEEKLSRPYKKIRIARDKFSPSYNAEFFTEKQSFQKKMTEKEVSDFIDENAGVTFRNVVELTDVSEVTILANKKGRVTRLEKKMDGKKFDNINLKSFNHEKNYILKEGENIPFLVELGVMTRDFKVVKSKYDKFRQINRFLEFIDDIIDDVSSRGVTEENPLRIIDFGSGKSYLTFATYFYLNDIRKIPVSITGLDLKEDVIKNCNELSARLGCKNLDFKIGNIADYDEKKTPDMIITLHACDVATDFALEYAVRRGARAILCVPCCQHEINLQLEKKKLPKESPFALVSRYGIIRERFSALLTDAIRADILEKKGYDVQVLEFIDMSHTPKNILIRALKKDGGAGSSECEKNEVLETLGLNQTLSSLMQNPGN